jgi:ribosome maturation factor RimP
MGVTESQPRILNQRIDYRYDRLNIDDLDRVSRNINLNYF